MYKFKDEDLKTLTDAYNLLDKLTIQGIQNVNVLGNSIALLQKFVNSLEKFEDPIYISKQKEDK